MNTTTEESSRMHMATEMEQGDTEDAARLKSHQICSRPSG